MTLEKETSIYQLGAIAGKFEDIEDFVATKNSIFHQPDAPSTSGRKVGDIWYDSDDGYSMYKFDGTTWVREQYGTNAISVGAVTAARLDAQDVYTNFLRVNFLAAAQAEIESLSAITANLGSVNVGGVNNEDGVITIKDANNQTIGYWNNTGINAQAGTIGPWYIGSSGIYNGKSSLDSPTSGTYIGTDGISGTDSGGSYTITPGGNLILEDTLPDTTQTAVILNIIKQATRNYIQLLPGSLIASNYNSSTSLCTLGVDVYSGVYSGRIGLYSTNGNALYYNAREGRLDFVRTSDGALITNQYNSSPYPLISSHNNGNISVSASGVGLYLGYENTTNLDFLHGKAAMDANGNFTALGNITSSKTSGQAAVYASNGGISNRIFIYADASSGQAGLYSYDASNTARAILVRANNSGAITAYGNWTFSNPIINPSDIRLKEHVRDSSVNALSTINSIPMREFDWKADGRHQAVGIIADELEEVDPGLVRGGGEDENGGIITKGIDSMYLIGYLVKAVQELSAKIDRLKGAA